MYFANNAGVLEFDGRNWRLIELPSRLGVRALANDPTGTGRIYVGAGGDFGYLSPDAAGQLQFTSLMPPEAKQDRGFDQVFTPVSAPDGRVYFQARTKLCRWFNGRIGCRDVAGALSRIFVAGRKLYVQQQGVGLMEMQDDSMRPVPGGERFAEEDVRVLLPYSPDETGGILVGLRTGRAVPAARPFVRALRTRRSRRPRRGAPPRCRGAAERLIRLRHAPARPADRRPPWPVAEPNRLNGRPAGQLRPRRAGRSARWRLARPADGCEPSRGRVTVFRLRRSVGPGTRVAGGCQARGKSCTCAGTPVSSRPACTRAGRRRTEHWARCSSIASGKSKALSGRCSRLPIACSCRR